LFGRKCKSAWQQRCIRNFKLGSSFGYCAPLRFQRHRGVLPEHSRGRDGYQHSGDDKSGKDGAHTCSLSEEPQPELIYSFA
jgi:hypothetical protein